MEGNTLFPTEEGTPQGGVISPLLANIALHGMEEIIKQYAENSKWYTENGYTLSKSRRRESVSLIRYADDFVVMHENLEVILDCKKILVNWLAELGLELKPSKTRITHTLNTVEGNNGFNFLGFHTRQYPIKGIHNSGKVNGKRLGFKTLIKPSKEKIKLHTQEIGRIIKNHKSAPQDALIKHLNPVIRGWTNYYKTVVCKEVFSHCDNVTYQQLRAWSKFRHPNKPKGWIAKKYWHIAPGSNWVFRTIGGGTLYNHRDTKQVNHIKIQGDKSPYDGNLTYWSSRTGKHPEMPIEKAVLLKRQKGRCAYCGLQFRDGDIIETDHIIPTASGGKNGRDNKQLLHRHCHDSKTTMDMTGTHEKSHVIEERSEVKVSRSVLKTSVGGDIYA
jgi:RNA-directed DNA polymerase